MYPFVIATVASDWKLVKPSTAPFATTIRGDSIARALKQGGATITHRYESCFRQANENENSWYCILLQQQHVRNNGRRFLAVCYTVLRSPNRTRIVGDSVLSENKSHILKEAKAAAVFVSPEVGQSKAEASSAGVRGE
ncbi:DNA methylase N-4/N-6 domain-containing protein [Anopheles sinensis]|uniref:DNA methylase N-4/N-6 domain-containing protein n=1 Tax=Anopheles sinensis TaxID=74873 RepID=A0A084W3A6_ANOSI|nr:DNA methylase N-4/N-6 domain-containing protein [Anopheles sinensis]